MKPLFLSDNNKLVAAYRHALRAITTLLTRAGVFLISFGTDGYVISKAIASLADALKEFQGIAIVIEDWVEHMINNQNNAEANPVESGKKAEDDAALPRTPSRSTNINQSPCLGPTPAAPSPAAPHRVSTPWLAFPQSSPQVTSPFRCDITNIPLSIRNAPALCNHMRVVPPYPYHTPTRTLGLFRSPMTSRVTTPLAHGGHISSINTSRQIPSLFWRPAPQAHAIKLMVPGTARHRKKAGKENEEEVSVLPAASRQMPSLFW